MNPNILMIMTDQHSYDALSYINPRSAKTPNIDKLADRAVVFTNAYTPSPVCAPARAAIKSGKYPPKCGVVNNWVEFKEDTELLTHRLVKNGYQTALCGKLHFMPHEDDFGFTHKRLADAPYSVYANDDKYSVYIDWLRKNYFDKKNINPVDLFDEDENSFDDDIYTFCMGSDFRKEEEHDIPWVINESIDFLENRDVQSPFFLYTSIFGPHQPYIPPAPWRDMYNPNDIELNPLFDVDIYDAPIFEDRCQGMSDRLRSAFSIDDYKKIMAAYYGQISMIDHYIGKLFDYLKNNDLWDNTMIIFTSDHGDFMGAYGLLFKGHMYDACCKVPLIIKPAFYDDDKVIRAENVNSIDLYSTILDAANDKFTPNSEIESRSLTPLFDENFDDWDNTTYSIIGKEYDSNLCMMRKDNLKIIRLAKGETDALYELYDMNYPETKSVYNDEDYRADAEYLKAEIDDWWLEMVKGYKGI